MSLEETLAAAQAGVPEKSDFDYIVVGSGAGGGPLAARLALAGKKVLVIEAGGDPMAAKSVAYDKAEAGEVTEVPGYYAAASEDEEMSWMFSVRHYADTARQAKDAKYNKNVDPATGEKVAAKFLDPHPNGGKQGIFYPRAAGLGGCTAHHAMITIAPNDKDWNYIANLTGDDSWRAGKMRGYFAKFERNQYLDAYDRFLGNFLGWFYRVYRWLVLQFDPRAILDRGGHGFEGWAPTNFIDPFLISTIAREDRPFFRVIVRSALGVLQGNYGLIVALKQALLRSRAVQAIDFNDINTRRTNPEGVFLIPIGTESGNAADDKGQPGTGRRFGVREHLLSVAAAHPDKLVIRTGVHVTRVLFEKRAGEEVPRAIGVECAVGAHLYEASPRQKGAASVERVSYFVKELTGEVILCGGAFNTPQLLMLSGIGEKAHLADKGIGGLCGADGKPALPVIDLPGVGRNLQDRYEVTVVSAVDKDFATLDTVSFLPGDKHDRAREQWRESKTGLYTTNGGTLAVIRRSQTAVEAGQGEPDLFTFGAPAAFRGYYWNWSRELFKRTLGAEKEEHKLWSWVILKAYTRNDGGTVRLRSGSAFDMPEICFDAFNEKAERAAVEIEAECLNYLSKGSPLPLELEERRRVNAGVLADSRGDLAALADAVAFMRKVNAQNPGQFVEEIQPGAAIRDFTEDGRVTPEMEEWIKTQAWGHHASCTCRIGSDAWRTDTKDLADKGAVLDSRLRVHGVKGLRVVDASVFPKIPGYFILAPIFMMSEKAADTLLEDALEPVYPAAFAALEAKAIRARRKMARVKNADAPLAGRLPGQTVGLALSGGGIRSASFALGVLQALAERDRLRAVDLLSTVSGGGFIGSFLGRLFTRETVKVAADPCGRVQEVLANSVSAPLWWLRTQANYIFATGANDVKLNLAVFWRNIFTMHLVVGALLFTLFGLLAWLPRATVLLSDGLGLFRLRAVVGPIFAAPVIRGLEVSAWWWLPVLALGLGVLPGTLGYWLAPKVGSYRPYPFFALAAWLVLLLGAAVALQMPGALRLGGGALAVLLLAWLWQEAATWGAPEKQLGATVRNRLSRGLGEAVVIFAALAGWVVLDTLAEVFARKGWAGALAAVTVALGPALPWLRELGVRAKQELSQGKDGGFSLNRTANLLGLPLAVFLLFAVDVFAHRLFLAWPSAGIWVVALAALFSAAIGRAFDFLNLSSLHATYAARLTRTFQGASNEERVYSATSNDARDIGLTNAHDDVPHENYHPEAQGGPLHFINVCVNETVDTASAREVRERQGLPMCVTPHGVSVGRRYFARWTPPDAWPRWQKRHRWINGLDGEDRKPKGERKLTALAALPMASDPNGFHVLRTKDSASAEVESLSLGAWIAISGAAFSTGLGRGTKLTLSLFMGLANVRLGYWWDSGIRSEDRPGAFPPSLWRRVKRWPVTLFRMQSMLLAEWKARFHGAARWFWYLSDGGHFEVTALYELVRRRVPLMIVSEAGEDPQFRWGDVALLTQQVRTDFGAEIMWLKPLAGRDGARLPKWDAFPGVPEWIREWIEPEALGDLEKIGGGKTPHAALAQVSYAPAREPVAWILLLKPSLGDGLTEDLRNYAAENPAFPQQPTFDQVFDDVQWECHRALGQQIGRRVLRKI